MEFLHSFPRLHFAGEPEVASPNVGYFLRHFANIQISNIAQLQLVLKIWQLPHDILNTERKQRVHTKKLQPFFEGFSRTTYKEYNFTDSYLLHKKEHFTLITFKFSELSFIFCPGQPKSIK